MGKIVKMSFEGQNLQLIGKCTAVLCFQKEIDSRGCSDQALGLHTWIFPFYSNKFIGIYLRFQVSVYRTIGPLVFTIFAQNIDCDYTIEPPQRGGSNKYPQSMFWSKNRYTLYTTVSQYKNGVLRGYTFYGHVFLMWSQGMF